MFLCRLTIPLKNHLSLPSGSFFNFEVSGRLVGVQTNTVQGEIIYSYSDSLSWLNEQSGLRAEVSAKKRDKQDKILKVYFSELGLLQKGYVQPNRFTIVDLYFEEKSISSFTEERHKEKQKIWVEQCLEYFVSHYLEVGCDNDIPKISLSDVPVVTLYVSERYEFTKEVVSGDFKFHQNQFNWYETEKSGHLKDNFSEQWCRLLQGKLGSNEPVPIYNQLLMDAKRQSFYYNNQELSIVLCESAFETFVVQKLLSYCNAKGILEIGTGKGKNRKSIPVGDCVEHKNISELLSAVCEVSGDNVKAGTDHLEWTNHAYNVRNKIIHRGKKGHTKTEAEKAFFVVNKYMCLIRDTLRL
ncbi:MAG: hypothetical protein ACJAWP_000005 [Porticoccus sp.]|jgi:hypothetical protein|uniref:hypothetical protein n=1 Tax=Porticoccus sp. TaxID=2024853 RepID=UPI0039E5ED71